MKKQVLFLIIFSILSSYSFGQIIQDLRAKRLRIDDRISLRGQAVDTIKVDTVGWAGRSKSVPSADAVYKFVLGRLSGTGGLQNLQSVFSQGTTLTSPSNTIFLNSNTLGIGNGTGTFGINTSVWQINTPTVIWEGLIQNDTIGWLIGQRFGGLVHKISKSSLLDDLQSVLNKKDSAEEKTMKLINSGQQNWIELKHSSYRNKAAIEMFNSEDNTAFIYFNNLLGVTQTSITQGEINTINGHFNQLRIFTNPGASAPYNPADTSGSIGAANLTGVRNYQLPDSSGTFIVNPMSSPGDIIIGSTSGKPVRLPSGPAGYVLKSNGIGVPSSWQPEDGSGSGTVNSGNQYRLAYYASTGTAVSQAAAITANRALISDANGVPTHTTTTATEIGYVNGVTSAIQTQLNSKIATTRTINTTSPLTGGGDMSADRTLSIANAAADGSTKGAASFSANDFNATSGNVSLDYTNGQKATASQPGFMTPGQASRLDSNMYLVADEGINITKPNDSTYNFSVKYDTTALASFGAGGGQAGDTVSFSTSTIYGSFYNTGSDTLIITSAQAVLQGTSPSVLVDIYWNDSLNVTAGATKLVTAGNTITNTATGTAITSLNNTKIAPGNWVWVKTGTVTTKPTYFSLTLIGYKKRVFK